MIKSIQNKQLSLPELMTKQEPTSYEETFNYTEEYNTTNLDEENESIIPQNFEIIEKDIQFI